VPQDCAPAFWQRQEGRDERRGFRAGSCRIGERLSGVKDQLLVSRDVRIVTADAADGCPPYHDEQVGAEGVSRSATAPDRFEYLRERAGHNVISRAWSAHELTGETPGGRRVALAEQCIGAGIARPDRVEEFRVAGGHTRAR